MRVDTIIAALRPFADGMFSDDDREVARRLVFEFDTLPTEPVLDDTEPVTCTIGAKDGQVLFQTSGNALVEPMFVVWSIEDAHKTIEGIEKAIELAEGQRQ